MNLSKSNMYDTENEFKTDYILYVYISHAHKITELFKDAYPTHKGISIIQREGGGP